MAIDTATPRTRRALLFGALGGALASVGVLAKPKLASAADPNDVVLDANNTAVGTTQIAGTADAPVLRVASEDNVGVIGASGAAVVDIPPPIETSTGLYGASVAGHGVYGASDTGIGVYAANNSSTKAAIVAEGEPGTAIHGHANAGPVPDSPALTGLYGSATGSGVAIAADSASGLALRATSSATHGIKGRGQLDGVIGESPGARTGVVGYSGGGSAPAGPAKTGVYGEATQDTASRGVSGFSTTGQGVRGQATTGQGVQGIATTGQAVRGDAAAGGTGVHGQVTTGKAVRGVATGGDGVAGEATTGVGVRATATTGVALAVAGRATFSRSGKVTIPVGAARIDVTVPGGLSSSAIAFATLQYLRTGVYVVGARPNWPSSGKLRIYLNKSLASATPVAWFVIG
jgi:hypothetical protein